MPYARHEALASVTVACGAEVPEAPEPEPVADSSLSAEEVLAKAREAMAAARSYRFATSMWSDSRSFMGDLLHPTA